VGLSTQQATLVRLLLEGMRDKEIARHMSLGVPTVRTYLSRIFARTAAEDRVDLLLQVFAEILHDCRRMGRPQDR
jgi:DNA-binding CsgD family transcriptional regulator